MIRRIEKALLKLLLRLFALTEEPNTCCLHSDCSAADVKARREGHVGLHVPHWEKP